MRSSEKWMWYSALIVTLGFCGAFWLRVSWGDLGLDDERTYSAANIVLSFGLAVLVSLYVLDRFYYYKLLIGSVRRSTWLEERLNLEQTKTITAAVNPGQSATVVTLLYFLIGLVLYLFLLLSVVFHPGVAVVSVEQPPAVIEPTAPPTVQP